MADRRDPGKDREKDKDINTKIDAEEAMRRLMFASLLMYKIDDAVAFGGITE